MVKAKAFGLASLLFCGSIGGLAGEKQTNPADFAPFTVEVTRGGPIGVCTLTNPPMGKGVKFIVKPKEGEGSFKNGKGKILSSKSHGKNVWVAVENSATCFVTALKSLGTEKSTLVLCGGEWANSGNGGNGNSINKPDNWLAELSGQEELRLFLCHQYPPVSDDSRFNLTCRKSTIAMWIKFNPKKSLLLFVGVKPNVMAETDFGHIDNIGHKHNSEEGKKCGCPTDKACIRVGGNISAFLETKILNSEKLSEVYSVGHGYRSDVDSEYGLELGISCVLHADDKSTITCTNENSDVELDDSNPCNLAEYIGSFSKYLEDNANIFLMHCYTGNPAKSGSVISKVKNLLRNCRIVGIEKEIQFPVSTLSPWTTILQIPNNDSMVTGLPFKPAPEGRFVNM